MALQPMYYGEFCLFTGKHWNLFRRLKFYPAGLCGPAFLCFCSLFFKKMAAFAKEVKQVFSNVKTGAAMVAAGITISFNWGTFIWAVNNGHIVETSMGYYINPLVSILFAVVFYVNGLIKCSLPLLPVPL